MGDDDYESLPESSATSAHMLAGAAAGISEHCVMYPVDCVKVGQVHLWCVVFPGFGMTDAKLIH